METNGKRHGLFAGAFAVLLAAAMLAGCGKERAKSEYQKGVDAYYARDYAKAVEHYRAAAAMNDADAQFQLGWCYAKAEGVPMDWDKARECFLRAAEIKDEEDEVHYFASKSQEMLDAILAYEKNLSAAEQGDAEAQYNLGICYYNGRGVKKDTAEAAKWFREAAKNGNADAKKMLEVLDNAVPQP